MTCFSISQRDPTSTFSLAGNSSNDMRNSHVSVILQPLFWQARRRHRYFFFDIWYPDLTEKIFLVGSTWYKHFWSGPFHALSLVVVEFAKSCSTPHGLQHTSPSPPTDTYPSWANTNNITGHPRDTFILRYSNSTLSGSFEMLVCVRKVQNKPEGQLYYCNKLRINNGCLILIV